MLRKEKRNKEGTRFEREIKTFRCSCLGPTHWKATRRRSGVGSPPWSPSFSVWWSLLLLQGHFFAHRPQCRLSFRAYQHVPPPSSATTHRSSLRPSVIIPSFKVILQSNKGVAGWRPPANSRAGQSATALPKVMVRHPVQVFS